MSAFLDAVGELRIKHKIPHVLIAVHGTYLTGDESADSDEGAFMLDSWFGSQHMAMSLAAYAFGKESQEHDDALAQILKQARKRSKS